MKKPFLAHQQDCDLPENYRKYYGQLIGSVIQQVILVGSYEGNIVPVLTVKTFDGKELQVEVWSDPEGNGVGHLDIYDPSPSHDTATN